LRRSLAARLESREIHETDVATISGASPRHSERAIAHHVRRYTIVEALEDRLYGAYEYGEGRGRNLPPYIRIRGLFVGPPILAVQAARMVASVARHTTHLRVFLETWALTLCLLTAWSVGEWLGSVRAIIPRRPPSGRPRGTGARQAVPRVDQPPPP